MTGETTFGNTCLRSIRLSETPTDRAASTNVSSRTASTCDRMTRTSPGTNTMAMASDAFVRLAPRSAEIASASVSGGNVNSASMHRSMMPPSQPPKNPDEQPEHERGARRDRDDEERDEHRRPRAEDEAGEQVAADRVRPEEVPGAAGTEVGLEHRRLGRAARATERRSR